MGCRANASNLDCQERPRATFLVPGVDRWMSPYIEKYLRGPGRDGKLCFGEDDQQIRPLQLLLALPRRFPKDYQVFMEDGIGLKLDANIKKGAN